MRTAGLRLLLAAARAAALRFAPIAVLRLLPLGSWVVAALLAATAAFTITHVWLLRPHNSTHGPQEERFGAPAVSKKGRFASLKRPAVPRPAGAASRDLLPGHAAGSRARADGGHAHQCGRRQFL